MWGATRCVSLFFFIIIIITMQKILPCLSRAQTHPTTHPPPLSPPQIINAAELASYDVCKEALVGAGAPAGSVVTHLAAGLGAGFFAVCCGSPVDVVKSRMMGEWIGGVIDCHACKEKMRNPQLCARLLGGPRLFFFFEPG
jgi:hypothetical protein